MLPQLPQLASSVCNDLQTPEQHSKSPVHLIVQSPQFSLSLSIVVQEPRQHFCPSRQAFPHDPQLPSSVFRFLHTSFGKVPQHVSPVAHDPPQGAHVGKCSELSSYTSGQPAPHQVPDGCSWSQQKKLLGPDP